MSEYNEILSIVQAQGEHVEAQAKQIARLDELTNVQARLIESMESEISDMHSTLDAQWLSLFGANRYLVKSIDDIAFFLPKEAGQTLREAQA